jgi:hypothetical protein
MPERVVAFPLSGRCGLFPRRCACREMTMSQFTQLGHLAEFVVGASASAAARNPFVLTARFYCRAKERIRRVQNRIGHR